MVGVYYKKSRSKQAFKNQYQCQTLEKQFWETMSKLLNFLHPGTFIDYPSWWNNQYHQENTLLQPDLDVNRFFIFFK